ncbi:hypothetical protein [Comamonas sp. UBA7528]|uniref:hypothetical protein n=1 Tax=Comamonas sp. UBA7528 TaxID=1946391 RepID=UPI0025BB6D1D|nr:hypothetical protein [Comamonas sp. UBA7528]
MGRETVSSSNVIVTFDGQRCIHSRHCVLDRPDVFVPNVEVAWIHSNVPPQRKCWSWHTTFPPVPSSASTRTARP